MTYQELNQYILHYLTEDKTKSAIMLTGPWGTGKSYYIQNELKPFLEKKENGGHSCVIVSLYGLKDTAEISKSIYLGTRMKFLTAASEKSTTVTFAGETIIKGIAGALGVDLSVSERSLKRLYASVNLTGKLVVLEDLERSGIDILEVLGYVNNLVEQDGVKVLLVANEEELIQYTPLKASTKADLERTEMLDRLNGHKDRLFTDGTLAYLKVKEKTISDTIEFEEDYKTAIREIVQIFDNETLNKFSTAEKVKDIYDYLIVDEASQVDLATGVLAFSCARNIVIVGDLKQLPNVLTEDDIRTSDAIWQKYSLDERYRFSAHSLLSSALEIWQDAPVTLLREHYRCHPKIINFCNQKFYHGQLIVMTKDHDEPDVLTMYRTIAGNHARGHLNQRQIDVIQQEVLPRLYQQNFQSIGIITPYRDQVTAIRKQLGDTYEVDTVHKFQGREQDAIILTSVDNVITDFVDDPHMLNVAFSRAVHSLAVVTSQDPRNDQTNYGDLTRYIEYNNFEIIQSQIYSVFDMLYRGYAEQRREYLQKHKRVSEYDSENLMHSVIQEILSDEPFSSIGCAVHFSLATLVKDYAPLTEEERKYARNPLTHVDFLLFNQMDKQPVLAIEVDGGSHKSGSKQAARDAKKNSILDKCAIPLLRLRTDGSGEKEKIKNALKKD